MMNTMKRSVLVMALAGFSLASMAQTAAKAGVPEGWHLQDLQKNGYYGISLDKAYDFLKSKKSNKVRVAVIDSGIDTAHEDLRPVMWTNLKEIPGNGKDDDGNGYVDDIHGWNFLGGKDGKNVGEDSYEVARVYYKFKNQFENVKDPSSLNKEDRYNYNMWKRARAQVDEYKGKGMEVMILQKSYDAAAKADSILRIALGKPKFTGNEIQAFVPTSDETKRAKATLLYFFQSGNIMELTNQQFVNDFKEYLGSEAKKVDAVTNAPRDFRGEIVKDNYNDINDRYYGNTDIMATDPMHGTHVAGIIGAAHNGIGINGIADNVEIMAVRAVPDGDEHDKDVANAIRYAVDNGARVVNMSFGKSFSPEKQWVDDAVKYAQSKGVLLIHAAGNEGDNIDTVESFPTPEYKLTSEKASNWVTVGASGDPKEGGLVADFSNYGKKEVDVFAPGVKIYSTLPNAMDKYGNLQGTSMAAPVVTGIAALILEYYPNLKPEQVKYILVNSAVKPGIKGTIPKSDKQVALGDISVSGGLVNAYEAVKMADFISNGGKIKEKTEDRKIKVTNDKLKKKEGNKKETIKSF